MQLTSGVSRVLMVLVMCWQCALLRAAPVTLEQSYYHNGDMNGSPWSPPSIDVDSDGTVAIAINRATGSSNVPENSWWVLLYDKAGEPIAGIPGKNSGMVNVCFGPDGRIYTAESWFGTGAHIYDRAGAKPRIVPVRFFNADGSHVDRGGPRSVGVGPDYRMYTLSSFKGISKLYITSPENKLIKTIELPAGVQVGKIHVASDGTVYLHNKVLSPDGNWSDFPYRVRDIRPDGKLLVETKGKWGICDPKTQKLESEGSFPAAFQWADMALGPDDNLYMVPARAGHRIHRRQQSR